MNRDGLIIKYDRGTDEIRSWPRFLASDQRLAPTLTREKNIFPLNGGNSIWRWDPPGPTRRLIRSEINPRHYVFRRAFLVISSHGSE